MELSDYKNPLEVVDFSGGITDNVYWQDPRRAKTLDNLLIKSDRSVDNRPGSVVDDLTHPLIPAGNQKINTLINYANSDKLFVHSARKIYYRNPSSYQTLLGPTGNDVLSAGSTSNFLSFAQSNGHIFLTSDAYPSPQKIYKDQLGAYQVRSAGLPALAASPNVTAGIAGVNDYVYSFAYDYLYQVGTPTGITKFEDIGPVTQFRLVGSGDPSASANSITGIPVLANGATNNWDTSNIKVFIYRTLSGGTVSYKVGEVTNGTTTFLDSVSDAVLQLNDTLYIDDGTLDFDPPPMSRYIHIVNNTGYYASLYEGGEEKRTTIRQSIPGAPDKVPTAFEVVVEDRLTGMSSARSNPIALCEKYIYRIEQSFDNAGRGAPNAIRLSDTAGCVSHNSIVQAENGIFWFGNDGVYYCDSYQTMKVSDGNNERYKTLLSTISDPRKITGRFDEKERRIYWTIQTNSTSLDIDSLLTLELRWGISNDMPFETASGASFRPSAIEIFNKKLYRGDTRGYVFIHDPSYTTDPKVDTLSAASTWAKETIIWTYESINYNFGSTHLRKYVTKMLLTAQNKDNTSIQITAINDDGRTTRALKPIRWRRNFVWGDNEFLWGNTDCVWNAVGIIEQFRRMPAKGIRLSYLRLMVSNAFSIVLNSDMAGLAHFNPSLKTATLLNSSQTWPVDSVDYVITTEVDGYQKQFPVTYVGTDTIQVLDPGGQLPLGNYKWELWGYRKGEPLNLLSYNLVWDHASQTQLTYHAGQDGSNT